MTRDGLLRKMYETSTWYWIADQSVVYKRPVFPFKRFAVTVTAAAEDNALRYEFRLEDAKGAACASVSVRGKFKKKTGETVAPAAFVSDSAWHAAQLARRPPG